ncbi:MAG: retropepsin-like domain-containing protein [Candidatus Nitrosocosmicus sp.]|nr:retropepsin-like domain-containing protein [Candidatus Nitrosocosmicus sp.]MDN5868126.1 retropepsin-like domain-containing protein [Candidatus Nitrosocosmicus sp.]
MGYKLGHGYYIQATVICANPVIYNSIAFKIDTGCDITTISLNDALRLGINFSYLGDPSKSLGISGMIPTYSIFNCMLSFDLNNFFIAEKLSHIDISRPNVNEQNWEIIKSIPSLLGIDFLSRYTIRCDKNYIYLEK